MKGKQVWIKDEAAMRTAKLSEAMSFDNEVDARKSLKNMESNKKIHIRFWEIESDAVEDRKAGVHKVTEFHNGGQIPASGNEITSESEE